MGRLRSYRLRIANFALRIRSVRVVHSFNPQSAIRNPKSQGLTLIEVVASTMIVGMMAVATLNALGAATKSSDAIGNRAIALGLADELLSEIIQLPYSDPEGSAVFGRETGELATPRSAFDDIDDFNGWTASPPQYRDGTVIPNRTNWRQTVVVTRVTPTNPATTSASDLGAKRIRVTISFKNQVLADESVIRSDTDEK